METDEGRNIWSGGSYQVSRGQLWLSFYFSFSLPFTLCPEVCISRPFLVIKNSALILDLITLQNKCRESPGGSVVRTPSSHCQGPVFDPAQGTKIPQVTQCRQKAKKNPNFCRSENLGEHVFQTCVHRHYFFIHQFRANLVVDVWKDGHKFSDTPPINRQGLILPFYCLEPGLALFGRNTI